MFYGKFHRAMEWLKRQNEKRKQDFEEDLKLDKMDMVALLISALLVFGPIILLLIVIAVIVFFL